MSDATQGPVQKKGHDKTDKRQKANQMSEPKRIALTTLVAAEASSAAAAAATTIPNNKKDKKSAGQETAKTQRFSLTLPDSTEKSCPEFNFADLIAALPVHTSLLRFFYTIFSPTGWIGEAPDKTKKNIEEKCLPGLCLGPLQSTQALSRYDVTDDEKRCI